MVNHIWTTWGCCLEPKLGSLGVVCSDQNMYSIDHDVLEVLSVLLDEFDLPKTSKEETDYSLEIQNPLLDEILRPLMPPQKVCTICMLGVSLSALLSTTSATLSFRDCSDRMHRWVLGQAQVWRGGQHFPHMLFALLT